MRYFLLFFLMVALIIPMGDISAKKVYLTQKAPVVEKEPLLQEDPSAFPTSTRGLLSAPPQTNSILIDSARNGYGYSSSGPKSVDWTIDLFGNEWFGVCYRKFVPGDPATGIIGVAELDATAGFSYSNFTFWDYINNVPGTTIGGRFPSFLAAPEGPVPVWNQYDVAGTPTQSRAMLSFDIFGWGPFAGGFIPPVNWAQNSNPAIIHSLWLGCTDLYKDPTGLYHIGGVWEIDLNSGDYTFIHGTSTDLQTWTFESASLDWPATLLQCNVPRFAWGSNGFGAWMSTGYLIAGGDTDYKVMLCTTDDYGVTWSPISRYEFSDLGIPETITAADSIYIPDPNNPNQFILYTGPAEVGITYDFDLIILPNNDIHIGCTISWGPPVPNQPGFYYPNRLHMGLYDIKSTDQGASWTNSRIWWPAGLLIGDSTGNYVTTNEIDLGYDPQGNIYAAWRDRDRWNPVPTPYPHFNTNLTSYFVCDIWSSMSRDGGATWSEMPFRVTNDQQNSSYGVRLATRTNWYPNDGGKTYVVYQIADLTRPLPPPVEIMADHVQWYYMGEAKGFLPPNHSVYNMNIISGWNLIGLPLEVTDMRYQTLFPNALAGTLFGWNGSYELRNKIELGEAYWLRFPAAEVQPVSGVPVMGFTLELIAGWNMIAGPSGNVALSDIQDPGGIIVPGTLFGFDGSYYTADTVKKGQGYWLRTTSPGLITLSLESTGFPSLAKNIQPAIDLSREATLEFRDASGASQKLYFDVTLDDPATKIQYSLPPLPPQGAFDVRFAGDYRISEGDEATILLQSSHYPVTISASNLPLEKGYRYEITEIIGSKVGRTLQIGEGEEIQISNPQVTALRLSRTETVPVSFTLEQNYPNPFNPTTEIKYSIPSETNVELVIYNSLGQKVKTLVSARQDAGYHQVVWDGLNDAGTPVASGIYYYRIKAGKHQAIKKMTLLK
ncbi:MAG: hypothetical protein Kow0042_26520 [Calditrichia bacterium]